MFENEKYKHVIWKYIKFANIWIGKNINVWNLQSNNSFEEKINACNNLTYEMCFQIKWQWLVEHMKFIIKYYEQL